MIAAAHFHTRRAGKHTRRLLRATVRDTRGAALVEFAIIMPVLLALLMGTLEFGMNVYMRAVLEGVMQQAGRNSSLETAQAGQTAIDTIVTNRIKAIMPSASVTFVRENYSTFSNVGRPEDFTDANGNGRYDSGECFQDMNGDGVWNADAGRSGIGGANDVVEYTATVSYPSMIPGAAALKLSPTTTIKATTILRNQPFTTQPGWTTVQVCT